MNVLTNLRRFVFVRYIPLALGYGSFHELLDGHRSGKVLEPEQMWSTTSMGRIHNRAGSY